MSPIHPPVFPRAVGAECWLVIWPDPKPKVPQWFFAPEPNGPLRVVVEERHYGTDTSQDIRTRDAYGSAIQCKATWSTNGETVTAWGNFGYQRASWHLSEEAALIHMVKELESRSECAQQWLETQMDENDKALAKATERLKAIKARATANP